MRTVSPQLTLAVMRLADRSAIPFDRALLLGEKAALEKAGIEIPYPHQVVRLKDECGPRRNGTDRGPHPPDNDQEDGRPQGEGEPCGGLSKQLGAR